MLRLRQVPHKRQIRRPALLAEKRAGRWSYYCNHRTRDDRADARHGHDPSTNCYHSLPAVAPAQLLHPNVLAAALAKTSWHGSPGTVLAQERSYEARVTKAAARDVRVTSVYPSISDMTLRRRERRKG